MDALRYFFSKGNFRLVYSLFNVPQPNIHNIIPYLHICFLLSYIYLEYLIGLELLIEIHNLSILTHIS
jgi:hypothetical protein